MIEFEITLNCNFKCPYCFNGRNDVLKNKIKETSLETLIKTFSPINNIYIYGGEPLLSRNIVKFVGFLKEKNKNYVIQTNFSLRERILKILEVDPNANFQVSIHSTQLKHKETIKNVLEFYKNVSQADIMFTSLQDLKLYFKLKKKIPCLRLVPVADFGSNERNFLPSLILYNKLRKIYKHISFDDGNRSFIWEKQFLDSNFKIKGKKCICKEEYVMFDPSCVKHHCPQRFDGNICPFNSCFNLDKNIKLL